MKTLIAYATKHGTTEKCAHMLKESIGGEIDLVDLGKDSTVSPESYDTVIIGGSVYAGSIRKEVTAFSRKHLETLKKKNIGLFICGLGEGEEAEKELRASFPAELLENAKAKAAFGGELIFGNLSFLERVIMKKMTKSDQDVSKLHEDVIHDFSDKMTKV